MKLAIAIVLWAACGLCVGCKSPLPKSPEKNKAEYVRTHWCPKIDSTPSYADFNSANVIVAFVPGYSIYHCDGDFNILIYNGEAQP